MIRFYCEQCGHKISVQDKHAGKRGKCPECGAAFVVPAESAIIKLTCENCDQKITVPKTYAGKKVKCPTCKFILTIPPQTIVTPGSPGIIRFVCTTCNQPIEEPESSRGKLVPCPHCSAFTAVPLPETPAQQAEAPIQPEKEVDESEEHFEQLQIGSIKEFKQPPNVVTERKLPWILDIFLFPTSLSGMSVLAIIVLTRFFFRISVIYLGEASRQFLPCLAFFGFMWGLGIVARIVIYMYLCWYLCECIRGSAAGGVRAVETKGYNPGLWEMFGNTFRVALCIVLYLMPAIIYLNLTKRADTIFWSLFTFGTVFLPMGFIGISIYETLRGLNPVLVIGSIFSTLLPYLAMILTFAAAGVVIVTNVANPYASSLSFFITWLAGVYLLMVVAHLLGWFYHRYEEKLNWDV